MTSQVNWGVLGLLMARPDYGYRLQRRFAEVYENELPLRSESHIYTALNELQRRGLIEEVPETNGLLSGTDRQPRPTYRATEVGSRAYVEWILEQIGEDRRRSRLFVRQLAVFAHEPDTALRVLDRYENECLSEAADAPLAALADEAEIGTAPDLAARLIAEESRLAMEARLPWVEYARETFRSLRRGSNESART